jgi:hypothetical protein
MNERNMLYSLYSLGSKARRGDDLKYVIAQMPRVISLNILDFVLRPSGKNFHQVGELVYRELPYELLVDRFAVHHLQLPLFRNIDPDYTIPLHNWLKALTMAQDLKKSLKEVITMEARLQEFYDYDLGFAQFVERHGIVASDPKVREEYDLWRIEQLVTMEEAFRNRAEGKAEGITEGITIGRGEGITEGITIGRGEGISIGRDGRNMEFALKAFRKAISDDSFPGIIETLREFDIPEETINIAMDEVKANK